MVKAIRIHKPLFSLARRFFLTILKSIQFARIKTNYKLSVPSSVCTHYIFLKRILHHSRRPSCQYCISSSLVLLKKDYRRWEAKESSLLREAKSFWSCAGTVVVLQNKSVIQKGGKKWIREAYLLMQKQTLRWIFMSGFEKFVNNFRI